jgi:hypothetical protein
MDVTDRLRHGIYCNPSAVIVTLYPGLPSRPPTRSPHNRLSPPTHLIIVCTRYFQPDIVKTSPKELSRTRSGRETVLREEEWSDRLGTACGYPWPDEGGTTWWQRERWGEGNNYAGTDKLGGHRTFGWSISSIARCYYLI